MRPLASFGLVLGLVGVAGSFLVQRRMEAQLGALAAGHPAHHTFNRAAQQSLFGVVLGLTAFLLLPSGPLGLLVAVGLFSTNALVLFLRRRAAAEGPLRLTAVWALCASLSLFGGATAFLLGGGRVSFGG